MYLHHLPHCCLSFWLTPAILQIVSSILLWLIVVFLEINLIGQYEIHCSCVNRDIKVHCHVTDVAKFIVIAHTAIAMYSWWIVMFFVLILLQLLEQLQQHQVQFYRTELIHKWRGRSCCAGWKVCWEDIFVVELVIWGNRKFTTVSSYFFKSHTLQSKNHDRKAWCW